MSSSRIVYALKYSTHMIGSPIIAGAAVFKLRYLAANPSAVTGPFVAGVLVAGIVGALAIGVLLRYLQRAGCGIFVVYRLLLAAIVLASLAAKL